MGQAVPDYASSAVNSDSSEGSLDTLMTEDSFMEHGCVDLLVDHLDDSEPDLAARVIDHRAAFESGEFSSPGAYYAAVRRDLTRARYIGLSSPCRAEPLRVALTTGEVTGGAPWQLPIRVEVAPAVPGLVEVQLLQTGAWEAVESFETVRSWTGLITIPKAGSAAVRVFYTSQSPALTTTATHEMVVLGLEAVPTLRVQGGGRPYGSTRGRAIVEFPTLPEGVDRVTGLVQIVAAGRKTIASAPIDGSSVAIPLPSDVAPGRHSLRAHYIPLGPALLRPAESPQVVDVVRRAHTRLAAQLPAVAPATARSRLSVRVTCPTLQASRLMGHVLVRFRGKLVGHAMVRRTGEYDVLVRWPRRVGSGRLVVRFAPSARTYVAPSVVHRRLRLDRAVASTEEGLPGSPTRH